MTKKKDSVILEYCIKFLLQNVTAICGLWSWCFFKTIWSVRYLNIQLLAILRELDVLPIFWVRTSQQNPMVDVFEGKKRFQTILTAFSDLLL